jgi:hypothetical protein
VHAFVATHNRVDRAGIQAECAPNAPVFINKSHRAWCFNAKAGVQGNDRLTGDTTQPFNTFSTPGRALVNGSLARCNRFGIGLTVWIATTCALGLGQSGKNTGYRISR